MKRHPVWRAVLGFFMWQDPPRDGRSYRLQRGWWLRLSCGHEQSRRVAYRPGAGGRGVVQVRSVEDVLPPPRRIRCTTCEDESPGDAFTEWDWS